MVGAMACLQDRYSATHVRARLPNSGSSLWIAMSRLICTARAPVAPDSKRNPFSPSRMSSLWPPQSLASTLCANIAETATSMEFTDEGGEAEAHGIDA